MIVATANDANTVLVGCGCCPIPQSPAPRKECQSVAIDACGESLPVHEGVPAEDRCKIYSKVKKQQVVSTVVTNEPGGGFGANDVDGSGTQTWSCEERHSLTDGDCGMVLWVIFNESYSYTEKLPDDTVFNTVSGVIIGSGVDGDWNSNTTITTTYPPDDADVSTNPGTPAYPGCPPVFLNEDFNYAAGVFTEVAEFVTISYTEIPPDEPEEPPGGWGEEGPPPPGESTLVERGRTTQTITKTISYTEQVTREMLESEMEELIEDLAGEDWPGAECNSLIEFQYGYPDPELDEEGEPIPPDPEAPPPEPVCTQITGIVKARYRIGIPDTEGYAAFDEAHAAWVIAHAAWVSADPDERGPEPIEPIERGYFEVQWDEVFFPKEWDEWRALKTAFDIATAAKEVWDNEDPATRGDEPVVPASPGEEPEIKPSLVASRSWTYTGGDDFSAWFIIPIPTVEGESRVVNMMTKHYKSNRFGTKPTAHGEIYEMP